MKRQNADQNDDDGAERHNKVDKFHGVVSLSLGFFILPASDWPDRKRNDHEKRGSAETGEASWCCIVFCAYQTLMRTAAWIESSSGSGTARWEVEWKEGK